MAGRFWKRRATLRRARAPRAQGITGRPLIAAIAVGLVAVVTTTGTTRAQTGGAAGPSSQPPPFVEPTDKPRPQPPAEKAPPEKAPAAAQPAPSQPPAPASPPAAQPPAQPAPAPSQPYAPYPYAPQYPYGQYAYPPYPQSPGYPPQYPAPAYPPPSGYPPQPTWPPSGYPPPPAAYPPPPSATNSAYPPPPTSSTGGAQVPTLTGYAAPPLEPPPRPPIVDPQGDRVILLPTATTHPQGTFYFSNYELIVFQAGYAFTDNTQLSVTTLPVPRESVAALDISLKSSIYRGGLVRVAAIGSASGVVGKEIGVAFLGRAGAVVQVCVAQRCESSLSLSANAVLIGTLLMVNGAGGIWRISPHVSLLGELATMLPVGTSGGQFNGALLSGGVRLHYTHWAFDFTALHVLDSSDAAATVPFLAMTWRP